MGILKSLAVMAACFVGAPASAQTVAVDNNFYVDTVDWDGAGRVLIRWRPVLIDGKISICGAYAVRGGSLYSGLTRRAMRNIRAENGQGFMMPNMGFFRQVSSANYDSRAQGVQANCRVSSIAGSPADLQSMRLRQTVFKY